MKQLVALTGLLFACQVSAGIEVQDGYVRATPPGAPASAAFMTLHNDASEPVSLIAAHTRAARSTELHRAGQQDGMMTMRKVARIVIPAKGSVTLQPGGYHLMLIGLTGPLKSGDRVELKLDFEGAQSQTLTLPVRRVMAGQGMEHHR